MRNCYTYASAKDLNRLKNPSDNLLRGIFDDNGLAFRQKEVYTNRVNERVSSNSGQRE